MTLLRSQRWTAALLALVLLGACRGATVPDPEQGMFAGRWDGHVWIGDASAYLASDGTFYIGASAPRGGNPYGADESLGARAAFTGTGVYALGPQDVHFSELTGGDVITAEYSGSGQPAGILRITRFDGPGGVVEGELSFRATTNSPYASYGPTARLDDGKFRATVTVQTPLASP